MVVYIVNCHCSSLHWNKISLSLAACSQLCAFKTTTILCESILKVCSPNLTFVVLQIALLFWKFYGSSSHATVKYFNLHYHKEMTGLFCRGKKILQSASLSASSVHQHFNQTRLTISLIFNSEVDFAIIHVFVASFRFATCCCFEQSYCVLIPW